MKQWLDRLVSAFLPDPPRIEPGEDVVLVDVRTDVEYRRGHAVGARHIPLDQVDRRWRELRKARNRRVLVYCRSGHRAAVAARLLEAKGFDKVENAGSLRGLRRAGVELNRGG